MQKKTKQDELIAFLKNQSFLYQTAEIYGGQANSYDYGPNGIALKNNIRNLWLQEFVQKMPNVVQIESSVLLNEKIWEASGHLKNFSDPLTDCRNCKSRFRADQLITNFDQKANVEKMTIEEMTKFIETKSIICPNCGKHDFTEIRNFNLMFKTNMGVVEEKSSITYLRPELAQGIFLNFKNVQRLNRQKIPFGIAQTGKSFRNEITPGNFIFRTREFEQMEIEFFIKPEEENKYFDFYKNEITNFLKKIGIKNENLIIREHELNELAHYARKTIDFEYKFFHGTGELWGLASRGDFDLKSHQEHTKTDLTYHDTNENIKYLPFVIEPSVGLDRLVLAIVTDAYSKEKLENNETREVLKLDSKIAPYQVAILPLQKQQKKQAETIFKKLLIDNNIRATFDEGGNIGKRYRRQDAQGTPYCVTVDFDSEQTGTVTIRDRDTMNQKRIKIEEIIKLVN